jgi:hypothetical protein
VDKTPEEDTMPRLPYTYIIYRDDTQDGTPTVAQNSITGGTDFQGADAASVFLQTFAEDRSILVKAGEYDITSPLDLQTGMALTFEPGANLRVPNGYDQYVFGFGDHGVIGTRRTSVSGGFIREIQAGGPGDGPQRLWRGVRMLKESAEVGDTGIRSNLVEGLEIWDADVAIELLIEHELGWINANVFRGLFIYRCNGCINFDMSEAIDPSGQNGFNRNLFHNIVCQTTANMAFGVQGIRHRGNLFLDVEFIDAQNNPSAVSASIHPHAEDTLILGGTMTVQNFNDEGDRTQIIDPSGHGRIFLNRLNIEGGDISVNDGENRTVFQLDSSAAHLRVGTSGNEGDITVEDGQGRRVFHMDGSAAHLRVGTSGNEGDITVEDGQGRRVFHIDGSAAHLRVGTSGNEGDITVEDGQGRRVFHMDGSAAHLRVGTSGNEGDITVEDGQGRRVFHFNSQLSALRLGASGSDGDLQVLDSSGDVTIHLDGQTGIVTSGGDCAESFEVAEMKDVEPGTVMVFGKEGRLRRSTRPYDKKVAGVISGGGDWRPGIVLGGNRRNPTNRALLALTGKVFCKVEAVHAPIEAGDLLTTSSTPGYAMKAEDPSRAFGALIGKALHPMADGSGLIPIIVARQ